MKQKLLPYFSSYLLFTFVSFFAVLILDSPIEAQESHISVTETFVEDGYEFHVGFEAPPSNMKCALNGEGIIEFEVRYYTPASSSPGSVFGVAPWYPGTEGDEMIETHGKAIGPQGFCTKFSPCRIQFVRVVKAWCPPKDGPLFSW